MNKQQLPEDIMKMIEQEADEYVKRQGSHDNPDITKHDFVQGYIAALSSFPSSPKPIEGGLRWVKAINEIPDIRKCVIVRWFHSGNPDWIRVDISNGQQLLHWVNNNSVDIDSLEWLSESPLPEPPKQ